MKRIAVESTIDTSCVIALDAIDLIPRLSFLFSRVWLPKAVRAELFRRRRTKDRLRALLDEYDFLQNCDEYDHGAVDVLLIEWKGKGKRDRGEAEAIVQAAASGATVIIDERRGRKLAANFQLECRGTIWILRRFYELHLLTAPELRACLVRLQHLKLRFPQREANALLAEAGEEPLESHN